MSDDRGGRVGVALVMLLATPSFVASVAFAAGMALSPWVLVASVALAGAVVVRTEGRGGAFALLTASAIIVATTALASFTFDMTYDGQTYHQSAIRLLVAGWNPVADAQLPAQQANGVYITSLPKAAWTLAAMIYQASGSLEAAKGVQVVWLLAAFLLAWRALREFGASSPIAIVVAALAAGNPVAITQLLSFQVDGVLASAVVVVASLALLQVRHGGWRWSAPLVLSAAFLCNLKFPGPVYAALAAAAVGAYAVGRARLQKTTVITISLAIVSAAIEGINPYVTNTIAHGNPIHPVAGLNASQAEVHFDSVFARQPRFVQLARALASESSDIDERPPQLKVPFSIGRSELAAFGTTDTRIGGLGPLFGGILILAWAVLSIAVWKRRPHARLLLATSLIVYASALAIPFGYYSRYAPQLWLAPLPALLVVGLDRRVFRTLAALVAVNALLVGTISLGAQSFHAALQRGQLRDLARDAAGGEVSYAQLGAPFLNVDLHFDRYGIRHRAVSALTCATPAELVMTHGLVCLPDGRSPAPAPDPARVAAKWLSVVGR